MGDRQPTQSAHQAVTMVASIEIGKAINSSAHILVVDDEVGVGEFIAAVARELALRCTVTTNAADFLVALKPDVTLILSDLMMPDIDGIELLRTIGQRQCRAGIVLMS